MTETFNRLVSALTCVMLLSGCLSKTFSEQSLALSVDTDKIEVPGDMLSGDPVVASVTVTTNRSCNMEIVPPVDWVSIDVTEHEDLAGVSHDLPVTLSFLDNETGYVRSANLLVTTSEGMKIVRLVQNPLVSRLIIEEEPTEHLHYEGGEAVIDVMSNVSWSASITEQSDNADVSLSLIDTDKNGSVKVTFGENMDLGSPAYAVLTFTAEELEPVRVTVTQQQAVAYARITEVSGGEDVLASIGGTRFINVKSNVGWTLGIKDNAADNVTFSSTSGKAGEAKVKMTFAGNPEFDARREFTVQFVTEVPGIADGTNEHTLVQEKGSLLRFVFSHDAVYYWPFKDAVVSRTVQSPSFPGQEKEFTTYSGYTVTIFSNKGVWLNNTRGINIGQTNHDSAGDYIEFPVIEDRRLVKVTWQAAGGGSRTNCQIVSSDDPSEIVGPEIFRTFQAGDVHEWNLTDTEPSKAYRMECSRDITIQSPAIECYYE